MPTALSPVEDGAAVGPDRKAQRVVHFRKGLFPGNRPILFSEYFPPLYDVVDFESRAGARRAFEACFASGCPPAREPTLLLQSAVTTRAACSPASPRLLSHHSVVGHHLHNRRPLR